MMKYRHILLLDNFDSFTYNLVDFFRRLGCHVRVFRNTVSPELLKNEVFDLLVLSPGPSVPSQAGNMMAIIEQFYRSKPILGVCLGHQALVAFFGGSLANIAPVHGKSVPLEHDGRGIFTGLEPNCLVARYHSWAADMLPAELEVSARAQDGTVIQFHPESVLSMQNNAGMRMLRNVVEGRLSAGNRIYHHLGKRLQTGSALFEADYSEFLHAVEEGQLSEDQKQILLVSLSHHLRQPKALSLFVRALVAHSPAARAFSALPEADQAMLAETVDVCGTGGSGLPRINTSTLTALALAGHGLRIAKHGNRAAAGRFGSFNLLEQLGIAATFKMETTLSQLRTQGLSFLFAPAIHPVFKHFARVRTQIGVPTIFNVLGPLVNPMQPRRQFIGTAFPDLMELIFETGIRLGKEHLVVACAEDGLDEISISGPTRILEYRQGQRRAYTLTPADFGLETLPFQQVSAANPEQCVDIADKIIRGVPDSEHYQLVAINAAFIYSRFIRDMSLPAAYDFIKQQIFSGRLAEMLQGLEQTKTMEVENL
jgi:anthranilate synthase/phosphoribosyltransferase